MEQTGWPISKKSVSPQPKNMAKSQNDETTHGLTKNVLSNTEIIFVKHRHIFCQPQKICLSNTETILVKTNKRWFPRFKNPSQIS